MFNLSTQDVVQSIEKAPLVILDGIHYQEYHNFFGKNILDQLKTLTIYDFDHLDKQKFMPRLKIAYHTEIMKKLKIFFMHTSISNALERKFKTDLKFESVDIWRDGPSYRLPPHTDDSRIKLALQIYLSNDNVGTSLYGSDYNIIKSFAYNFNSGYALLNNKFSLHGTTGKVTNPDRWSMYVRYS